MGLLNKIKDVLRGNSGIGEVTTIPLQEGHELVLEETSTETETATENEEIQTTFNEDGLESLLEEGVIENVVHNEN
jgi:hypothetical protein